MLRLSVAAKHIWTFCVEVPISDGCGVPVQNS